MGYEILDDDSSSSERKEPLFLWFRRNTWILFLGFVLISPFINALLHPMRGNITHWKDVFVQAFLLGIIQFMLMFAFSIVLSMIFRWEEGSEKLKKGIMYCIFLGALLLCFGIDIRVLKG